MSVITGQLAVGTATPTQVNQPSVHSIFVHIHNNDNTNHLLIGGANLNASNGMILQKLDSIEMTLQPLDILYLLSSSGIITASYLVRNT
jgi:hypothetical protein